MNFSNLYLHCSLQKAHKIFRDLSIFSISTKLNYKDICIVCLGEDSLIAKGYNYRFSNNYFDSNNTETRQLLKAYGILFIITVDAKAQKFNVIPTLQNLGSGLALLSIATIICDIFVLYIHKHKEYYREHKYLKVDDSTSGDVDEYRALR